MAGNTNYPGALDTTTNLPIASALVSTELDGDGDANKVHSNLHGVLSEAAVAIEAKIGTGASTPVANRVLRGSGTGTSEWAQVALATDVSGTLPLANTALVAGTGITLATNTLNVDASQGQITTVGALDAGSITSGFTSIDVGSGTIDTTGAVSTGALTLSGALISATDGTLDIGTDAAPFQTAYLQGLQIEQVSGHAALTMNAESADTDPYIVFQAESSSKWSWAYDSSSDFFGLYNYTTSAYPLAFLDSSNDVILTATGKLRLDYNGSGNSYLHEASADVVELVAGGVPIGFNTSGMEIPDSKFIEFASAAGTPTTDNSVQGVVIEFLAAEAITQFDAVYVSTTTGRVGRALATNAAKMPVIGIAIEAQGSAGSSVRVLTHGVYRDDGGFGGNMTVGAEVYAPEALGTLTTTKPTTTGDLVQVMGVATGVRSVFFNPSMDVIEHA